MIFAELDQDQCFLFSLVLWALLDVERASGPRSSSATQSFVICLPEKVKEKPKWNHIRQVHLENDRENNGGDW